MSQKVSRKSHEDKDKRSTNSPVKDMKKKMAANAEKEKLAAAEKTDKVEKTPEKSADKNAEKVEKPEKSTDKKSDKSIEKKSDKKDEKKDDKAETQAEKSKEESSSKEHKGGKSDKEKPDTKKDEPSKQKLNGKGVHNGVSDVTVGNGTDDALNGRVSADSEDDDVMLVIDDHDHDELFPELTYDDTSDVECFEPPTPESAPSRSLTRRSQVKAARTPETPRPADRSDGTPRPESKEPKESKLLKLKEEAPSNDRKLRSADSPKHHEEKKQESLNKAESENKDGSEIVVDNKSSGKSQEETEVQVVIEFADNDGAGEPSVRKPDTNYSRSRVKVSPYRRSGRIADQTNTSLQANYTGNNTTMEMDITESSSIMEDSNLDDSSYLRGLRSIRGRSSYKPLKEITLRHVANRSVRSTASANLSATSLEPARPTGTVVGRKRKPSGSEREPASGKRLRVLERLAEPFRRVAATLPSTQRRNAEIVGINTDLPLTAPVATHDTFDPESLKPAPGEGAGVPPPAAALAPGSPPADNKRCVIM